MNRIIMTIGVVALVIYILLAGNVVEVILKPLYETSKDMVETAANITDSSREVMRTDGKIY